MNKAEIKRCHWVGADPLYRRYHDREWGVPVYRDKKLFEFLVLESAQAGLSWITILRKRENYRRAFAGFDYKKVARFGERQVHTLMQDAGIVRNEAKIRAAINNARCFLEVRREFGTFSKYIWSFMVGARPLNRRVHSPKQIPAESLESKALAADMKKRGFKFLGSTTLYAHMQAVGMVNDHLLSCSFHNPRRAVRRYGVGK